MKFRIDRSKFTTAIATTRPTAALLTTLGQYIPTPDTGPYRGLQVDSDPNKAGENVALSLIHMSTEIPLSQA